LFFKVTRKNSDDRTLPPHHVGRYCSTRFAPSYPTGGFF
jgi:hypothetical protein